MLTYKISHETETVSYLPASPQSNVCPDLNDRQHCSTQSSQSSLTRNVCQTGDRPAPSCMRGRQGNMFLVSPNVLPAAPEKCSHVTHLETKLLFPKNLLTNAKKGSRLYQSLPNSYTLFKIPNVMHSSETVSVLLN